MQNFFRAKPLRMALGSLLIQKKLGCSDHELVEFRKRLTEDILVEINEMIIDFNLLDDPEPGKVKKAHSEKNPKGHQATASVC